MTRSERQAVLVDLQTVRRNWLPVSHCVPEGLKGERLKRIGIIQIQHSESHLAFLFGLLWTLLDRAETFLELPLQIDDIECMVRITRCEVEWPT